MALVYKCTLTVKVNTNDDSDAEELLSNEFEENVYDTFCGNPYFFVSGLRYECVRQTDE